MISIPAEDDADEPHHSHDKGLTLEPTDGLTSTCTEHGEDRDDYENGKDSSDSSVSVNILSDNEDHVGDQDIEIVPTGCRESAESPSPSPIMELHSSEGTVEHVPTLKSAPTVLCGTDLSTEVDSKSMVSVEAPEIDSSQPMVEPEGSLTIASDTSEVEVEIPHINSAASQKPTVFGKKSAPIATGRHSRYSTGGDGAAASPSLMVSVAEVFVGMPLISSHNLRCR